jgi:2-oxoglutarate ferredoxin oxidoreductase subunit gamma
MHLVAMNHPSLEKFAPQVKPNGVVVINSSLIHMGSGRDDVDELLVPANEIANRLGSIKVANIVALGAFVARSKIVDFKLVRDCVKEKFSSKEKLIPINIAALEEGKKIAQTT